MGFYMMCFLINRAFQRVPLRRGGELKAFLGSRAEGFLEEGHCRRGVFMWLRAHRQRDDPGAKRAALRRVAGGLFVITHPH